MQNSPFNDLSAELRNRIWGFTLATDKTAAAIEFPSSEAKQPPITQVCKQIRQESLQMFYANNDFEVKIFMKSKARTIYGVKRAFGQAGVKLTMLNRWLRKVDGYSHSNVRSLTISISANFTPHGYDQLSFPKEWASLAKLLKEHQYVAPRLMIRINWASVCANEVCAWLLPNSHVFTKLLADTLCVDLRQAGLSGTVVNVMSAGEYLKAR